MAYRKINIDFSTLPVYYTGKINWSQCIGKIVSYNIDGTIYSGDIKIVDVYDDKIKIEIDNCKPIIVYKSVFRNGGIAKEFGKKAKVFKYFIGEKFNDLLILDQKLITKEVTMPNKTKISSTENGYLVRCLRDHYEYEVLEKDLRRRRGCPICAHTKAIPGVNDISTTDPEFAKWVVHNEDKILYTRNTNKKILLKCPVCGREFMGIPNRYKGIPSCICNDHVSYPEKIMSSVLSQLKINYIHQLNQSHFKWCKQYKYDFYFEYHSQQYIIEMDGSFHYIDNYKNNMSVEESTKIDRLKDSLAENNNCKIIRINSNYNNIKTRHDFIKTNILNSDLAQIFDLSIIDWEECEKYALTSLVKTVNDLWNQGLSKTEIYHKVKLGKTTIDQYILTGKRLGLNNYKPGERHYFSNSSKKYIKVENSNGDLLCVHLGINDFSKKSQSLIGVKVGTHQIYDSLNNQCRNRKGLKFSYATIDEYMDFISYKKAS